MHAGQQLMHDLHRGADADFRTQPPDFGGDGIQHRRGLGKGSFTARTHHRHFTRTGLDRATRHWRVQIEQARSISLGCKGTRRIRRHGGGGDNHTALRQAWCRAIGAEDSGFSLCGIHHQHHERFRSRRQFAGFRNGSTTSSHEFIPRCGAGIAPRHLHPRAQQAERRAHAHAAQTNHPNTHQRIPFQNSARSSCASAVITSSTKTIRCNVCMDGMAITYPARNAKITPCAAAGATAMPPPGMALKGSPAFVRQACAAARSATVMPSVTGPASGSPARSSAP